jgi:dTMP kinase
MQRGLFIAIEGPDGSGKSTQAKVLANTLRKENYTVLEVREPGGTKAGELVRQILLNPDTGDLSIQTELMLFMAARAQLVDEVILPALKNGTIVISDRFMLSTIVYQGIAGGIPVDEIRSIGLSAAQGLSPDITFVIDVPTEIGMKRVGNKKDRMEQKGFDFHSMTRKGYLDEGKKEINAIIIDGTSSIEEVSGVIIRKVHDALR